jgi:hypothetical protein
MESSAESKFRLSGFRLEWSPDGAAKFGYGGAQAITRTDPRRSASTSRRHLTDAIPASHGPPHDASRRRVR